MPAMRPYERTAVAISGTCASTGAARVVRRGVALAFVALLLTAAAAFAAAHFKALATYSGRDGYCSSRVPRTTCLLKFRASHDGLSLRFVGTTVIDAWGCRGGGGEALLGGEVKGATPIPLVKVRANGTLFGSVSYVFRPAQGPPDDYKVTVTGQLAKSARTAVITFHNTYISSSGNQPCATQPVTLTAG